MKTEIKTEEISDYEDELKEIKTKKRKKKLRPCFFCDKIFDVNSVQQTLRYHRCRECLEAKIEKKIKYKDVVCNFCGKKYVDTYYTKRGLTETKTRTKKCDECKNKKIPKGPLPRPKMEHAECDICGMVFKKKINIYNHMDRHRSDVCCRVCGAKFTARSALRSHLRTHFEQFICDLCGFTTNVSALLRKHKKAHAGTLPERNYRASNPQKKGTFTCSHCGIVFQTKVALLSHEKRQHSENGVNGFTCKTCGHVSYRIKEYRIHALSHSSKPLLFCHYPNCNIFYDRLKPLNSHIRNVHKATYDYSCEVCNKTFKYKHSVEKHQRNNRCVPLTERNLLKDSISNHMKKVQHQSTEELERMARIAKEQYLEVRGSITVLKIEDKNVNIEEEEEEIRNPVRKEEILFEEKNVEMLENIDDMEIEALDDMNDYDDILGSSSYHSEKLPKLEIELLKKEDFKVEIKTEPDIETFNSSFIQDDWSYYNVTNEQSFKNDEDLKGFLNTKSILPNPYVFLERLDYETITKYLRIKDEDGNLIKIKSEPTKMKMSEQHRRKLNKMRKVAFRRRIKGASYQCDLCDFQSKSKNKLIRHFVIHRKKLRNTKHSCEYCKETFNRRVYLREHQRQIHNIIPDNSSNKKFVCDLCGKGFSTITLMKSHVKIIHNTERVLQCSYCPLKFKTKMYLERHESDVHLKIYRYPCPYCGKFFKRKHQLKNHELKHITPPEECKICGKMVKIMQTHIKFVHEMKKKPPELIPCPQCGKGFSKGNLQLHIDRTHNKVIDERTKIRHCLQCDQTFTRVDDLRRHDILTHFQGIPKKCPYEFCDAIFKKTKPLNVHIKNRHQKHEHYCHVCGKKFNTRSGLLKHIKIKGHKPLEDKDNEEIEEMD